MGLTQVERFIGSTEDLRALSIEELTELCFDQQYPSFLKDKDRPAGYIPSGATFTIENFVDIRPAVSEFYGLKHKYDYVNIIGKLLLRRKLEEAETAKKIPPGSTPIFTASREFKNIFDLQTGKYRHSDEYFHIIDRRLVSGLNGTVLGSESRKYELRRRQTYLGQEGQSLTEEKASVYFVAGYPPELSPYEYYDDRPDANTALITEDELRALLIKWGELDRPVQLEIETA